jgi:hypothetical protein
VTPAELQIAIREGCSALDEPLTCDVAVDASLASAAYEQLLAASNVRESLNLLLQSVWQERTRLSALEAQGTELLAALRVSIAPPTGAS